MQGQLIPGQTIPGQPPVQGQTPSQATIPGQLGQATIQGQTIPNQQGQQMLGQQIAGQQLSGQVTSPNFQMKVVSFVAYFISVLIVLYSEHSRQDIYILIDNIIFRNKF